MVMNFFSILVQNACPKFRILVQNFCSEFLFRIHVQGVNGESGKHLEGTIASRETNDTSAECP
jgi:hypothetical protein